MLAIAYVILVHVSPNPVFQCPKNLKTDLSSKQFLSIIFNESPQKMMKIAFYFMLKALFVLEMFTFWS